MKLLILASLCLTGWAANISPECLRKCPMNYAPICGEDGVTYANDCDLKAAECVAKKQIGVLHKGECTEADKPKTTENCMKPCPRNYRPVCGSDGVTYSNECMLDVAACQKKQSIAIAHQGGCEEKNEALKATLYKEDIPCLRPCPSNFDPICGSDGHTYPNTCAMEVTACEKKQSIKVANKGPCAQKRDKLMVNQLRTVQKPKVDPCMKPCTDDYRPVCGVDGKTYPNRCALEINECTTGNAIIVSHSGPCAQGSLIRKNTPI